MHRFIAAVPKIPESGNRMNLWPKRASMISKRLTRTGKPRHSHLSAALRAATSNRPTSVSTISPRPYVSPLNHRIFTFRRATQPLRAALQEIQSWGRSNGWLSTGGLKSSTHRKKAKTVTDTTALSATKNGSVSTATITATSSEMAHFRTIEWLKTEPLNGSYSGR